MTDSALTRSWPLVEVDAAELSIPEAQRLVGDALQVAIGRGEPFAAIVHMPAAAPGNRKIAGVAERIRMLKRLRPGLGTWCRGLAFVVSADARQQHARTIRSGDKLWGCPTLAVDDQAAAHAWALARLHDAGTAAGTAADSAAAPAAGDA